MAPEAAQRWRGWLRANSKTVLVAAFLFCALPLGLMSALLTPPGQVPDEPTHVARAAGLLRGAVFAVRKEVLNRQTGRRILTAGVKVDLRLYRAAFRVTTPIGGRPVVTESDAARSRTPPATDRIVFAGIPNTAQYFPAIYLPATLAMGLGKAAGLSPFHGFELARLAMLAAYLALGAAAIAVTTAGEAVLLAVLIMPMTVFLAGSVNSDGVLIALACLGAACLTRGGRWRLAGLACLACLLGSKITDLPILGLALLPLAPGFWRRARAVALTAAPVALWWALVISFVSVRFYIPFYRPGPLFTGDPATQTYGPDPAVNLQILLHPATRLLTLPWVTLADGGRETLRQMIGVLGGLAIVFPEPFYIAWGVALTLAIGGTALVRRAGGPRAAESLFVLALMAASLWLTLITEYIDWRPVGADHIQGMQGRYLLPLLPMLIFAVPRAAGFLPSYAPALPVLLMGLFDLAYVPTELLQFFYLH
jgi:hypothetical protein